MAEFHRCHLHHRCHFEVPSSCGQNPSVEPWAESIGELRQEQCLKIHKYLMLLTNLIDSVIHVIHLGKDEDLTQQI